MSLTSPEPVAVWWRGKVKLEGAMIVPVDRRPYNPFQYYFPASTRTPKDEGTRSLPYLFLQVNAFDKRAVLKFCKQYGVLGEFSPDGWKVWGNRVYEAIRGKQRSGVSPFERLDMELSLRPIDDRIAGVPPLSVLARPMTTTRFQFAQDQLQETIEWLEEAASKQPSKTKKKAQVRVQWRFREKLGMMRPYATWDKNQQSWVTGWDAGSLESLLYLMLLYDCQGRGHIKTCPWCKKVFMGDRPKMKYCSNKCGTNARVYKHRHSPKTAH